MTAAQREASAQGSRAEEWVVLAEACRMIGKARAQVLGLIVRGELEANTVGRFTLVSRASIDRYLDSVAT